MGGYQNRKLLKEQENLLEKEQQIKYEKERLKREYNMKYDKNFNQSREDQYMKSYYNNFMGQMQVSDRGKVEDSLPEKFDATNIPKDKHCASHHAGVVRRSAARDGHSDKENNEISVGVTIRGTLPTTIRGTFFPSESTKIGS